MSTEAISSGFADSAKKFFIPTRPRAVEKPLVEAIPVEEKPVITIESGNVEKKTLEVLGRSVEVYHITPKEDIPQKGRIFLANGWRSKVVMQSEYIEELTQAGYAVTTFDNDFTRGDTAQIKENDKNLPTGKYPKIEFVKAEAMKAAVEAFPSADPEEKIGIIAHSEGTIYSAIAATKDTDNYEYFLQINSAGLAKKSGITNLIVNGGIESFNAWKKGREEQKVNPTDVIQYVTENMKLAGAELNAIASTSTKRVVKHLKEAGIPTGAMYGKNDKVFPKNNISSYVDEGLLDHVAEVDNAAHELCTNPKAYAEKTIVGIEELRTKKKNMGKPLF